jgi:hypothetical protein
MTEVLNKKINSLNKKLTKRNVTDEQKDALQE